MSTPQHNHRCEFCEFLGYYSPPSSDAVYDLYYCRSHNSDQMYPDIVVRWGDDVSEETNLNQDSGFDEASAAIIVGHVLGSMPNRSRSTGDGWESKIHNLMAKPWEL